MKINSQFVFSFLDAFPLGIIFLNMDLSIFFANKFFCDSIRVAQTSLNGLQFSDISNFNLKQHLTDEKRFYRYEQIEISFDKKFSKEYFMVVTTVTIDFNTTNETKDLYVLILQDPHIHEFDRIINPSYQEWIKSTKSNIALIIYTFQTGLGPTAFLSINDEILKFDSNKNENFDFVITKIGLYLMTAVAQGLNQSEGLFGPMPVPGEEFKDFNAILYALHVPDREQTDPRTNKQRYMLVTIVYPKKYESMLLNRRHIRSVILDYFQIEDISEINKQLMKGMLNEILNIQDSIESVPKRTKKRKTKKRSSGRAIDDKLLQITELQNEVRNIYDFDKAVEETTKVIEKCIDFKTLALFGVDKFTNELFLIKTRGYYDYKIKNARLTIGGNSVCGKVAEGKKTILINDVSKVDYYLSIDPTIKSNLGVPIKIKNELLGVILVESEKIQSFDQDDANLLELFAEIISVIFDQHRNEMVAHDLNVLLNRLMTTEELEEAMEEIVKFAEILLNFTIFCVLDYRENVVKFIAHRGYGAERKLPKFKKNDELYFVNHVYKTKESMYVDDLRNYPSIPYYKVADNVVSEYSIPIIINNEVVSIVNVEASHPLERFELDVFETLANYAKLVWKIYSNR